jgi:hypothetical protein
MGVSSEIEVFDVCAIEDRCLLRSDVRREEQESVVGVIGRQGHSESVQLLHDDADILMPEVPFLLNKIPKASVLGLPSDNTVEADEGLPSCADLSLRHPLLESGPVQIEVG